MCSKLGEEQEKYINYYKAKKYHLGEKSKEFEENVMKKMGDFNNFEKMYMGLYIQNIRSELDNINSNFENDKLFYN